MTIVGESQIYRDLLRFKPEGMSPNAWAVKAGVSRTVWADMRRHGNPSRRILEKLLIAVDSSLAEFEALRLGPEGRQLMPAGSAHVGDRAWGWSGAPAAPLPLIASSLGGEWGEAGSRVQITEIRPGALLEQLPRPASLAQDADAYAITIVADTMWPRFRPGARVAVTPRSPVAVGDDVLARLHPTAGTDAAQTLIMHLAGRTGRLFRLRQFNPDLTIEIDAGEIEAILKIAGELL